LIGSALIPLLTNIGKHNVTRLVSKDTNNNNIHSIVTSTDKNEDNSEKIIFWDPKHKKLNHHEYEGFDIIIHLAGENIFGRWTDTKKIKY
jgi:hypothetical protein